MQEFVFQLSSLQTSAGADVVVSVLLLVGMCAVLASLYSRAPLVCVR